jgi:enamine deaminase RidA (YjgF/YER057c/UK114 family)
MVYLTTAADFQPMNAAYRAFFASDPPTRTTVVTRLVVPDARVEISMVAVPAGARREVVHPEGWQRSLNPYSYAIRTADTLFLAGLVSRNGTDNAFVAGDVRAQTRTIM